MCKYVINSVFFHFHVAARVSLLLYANILFIQAKASKYHHFEYLIHGDIDHFLLLNQLCAFKDLRRFHPFFHVC